jgi:hypothetical protein
VIQQRHDHLIRLSPPYAALHRHPFAAVDSGQISLAFGPQWSDESSCAEPGAKRITKRT